MDEIDHLRHCNVLQCLVDYAQAHELMNVVLCTLALGRAYHKFPQSCSCVYGNSINMKHLGGSPAA